MDGGPLASIGLAPGSREATDGLVSVRQPPKQLSVDEAYVVRNAQAFEAVDYVFFRRFDDGQSSQPAAFVIDNANERFTESALAKVHHELWLHGVVPLVYIAWPTRIDVLSCARGPDFWDNDERKYNPAASLEVASEVESAIAERRRFSFRRLSDGTFWEEPLNQPLANYEKAAHESLIQAVVSANADLKWKVDWVYRRLLLLTILVKFLEDRGVFPSDGWFGQFCKGARTFSDVLQEGEPGEVTQLLSALEKKFSGDVFSLPQNARLKKSELQRVARLVEAKTLDGQRYLWGLYSFDHLPVEIISHLYQRLDRFDTEVYPLPPFLASLLLDHVMPYRTITGTERVLDPACGSGEFLVGAYRRLITAWRANHNWESPDFETLKSILRSQVFGVDRDEEAIELTAFSLNLVVCDLLQPNVIWSELRFDRLRGINLYENGSFSAFSRNGERVHELEIPFDIIVGNPPFKATWSSHQAGFTDGARNFLDRGIYVPYGHLAGLFLVKSMRMLRSNGRLCLIQPSSIFYCVKSLAFRRFIAESERIETLFDFSSVCGNGYGTKVTPIAILIAGTKRSRFAHLTFRSTYRTAQRIGFELDYYDRHQLTVEDVAFNPAAARTNLLGGGRVAVVSTKFRRARTLGEFVESRDWWMGVGFIEGKESREHLEGMRFRLHSVFEHNRFIMNGLYPGEAVCLEPPLILIGVHETLPIEYFDRSVLTLKDEIVAIHAPIGEIDEHKQVFETLMRHTPILKFTAILNTSRFSFGSDTANLDNDIASLPYPEDESELILSYWESVLVDDTLNYLVPYTRLGHESLLLKNAADGDTMREYAAVFCRLLGSLYDNLRASDPVFIDGLICQPFFFGEQPEVEWLGPDCEDKLTQLVFEQTLPSLRTVRVVRFYHQNVLFIVKPDRLRYWIRSTAIRDADDTLADLRNQGY